MTLQYYKQHFAIPLNDNSVYVTGNLMRLNHTFVDRNRHCSGGSVATTDSDDTDTSIGMSMLNPAYWALEDDHSGSLPSLTEPLDSCCVLNLGGSPFENNRDVIPTTSNSPT